MDRYDYLMKFLIIGNAGTGKTCIMRYFLDSKFKEDSLHTIGVEFGTKIIRIDEKSIKLQIWDTAGAAGALVVYDVCDRRTFNTITDWISSVRDLALPNLVVTLVGNKIDLAEKGREVSESEGQQLACEHNVDVFVETSAKTGANILNAFTKMAQQVLHRLKQDLNSNQAHPVGIGPAQLNISSMPDISETKSRKCCQS